MKNERWSTPDEIKRVLVPSDQHGQGGPILFHENGRNWVFPGEGHSIFLGMSGTGKSRRGTIPMVKSFIQSGESAIILDPKGEIYYHTAAEASLTHDVHVIDFSHPWESKGYNPVWAPYEDCASGDPARIEIGLDMIDELAHALYEISPTDPFWGNSGRSVFIGAASALMTHAKPEQINLANVFHLITKGNERLGTGTYLKEFVQSLPNDSVAAMELFSYVTTAEETRAGIRSVFLQGISKFVRSEGRRTLLGTNDLCISQLDGTTPTMIYIILPDESPIYDAIAGVLCSQLMRHYIRIAQDKYNGKLPCRLNVCLEELASIGKAIPTLPHLMAASRSRNIRCHLVLQSLSQLDTLYGPSDATTITSNADVLIAFRMNHWGTLTELSNKCGEREVEYSNRVSCEKLITPTQLAAMETGQALVMISGRIKFITRLPDFTQMFDCSTWQAPQRTVRQRKPLAEPFDIKEWVKDQKRTQMLKSTETRRPYMPHPPIPHPFELSHDWPTLFGAELKEDSEPSKEEEIDLTGVFDDAAALIEPDSKPAPKRNKKKPAAKAAGSKEVILLSIGPAKTEVITTIRKHTKTGLKQVQLALSSLPHTFTFDSEQAAKAFLIDIGKTGAIAISGKVFNDDD